MHHHILGHRAACRRFRSRDDPIADRPSQYSRADFFDASRQVGPERVRNLQGEELLHIAALEFDIEGIEAGSLDPNQNFACAGDWLGNFFERWSSVVVADTNSLHHTVPRSEEHTSELQSLMRISYAVFCLKKKQINKHYSQQYNHSNIILT